MSYRWRAIDGKYVNQHFGRATQFLIFDVEDDKYEFTDDAKKSLIQSQRNSY